MKKIRLVSFLLVAVLSTVACGSSDREPFTPGQPETPEQPGGDDNGEPDTPALGGNGRYLVLYASRTNNTGRVAQLIQTTLDCDILEVEPETAYDNDYNAMLEVEPETPYDNDYNAMLERSQEELAAIRQGDYPPVKTTVENFDDYDMIFFGYPIWHGSMATPIILIAVPPKTAMPVFPF